MDWGLAFDYIFHHKEYATLGQSGERAVYRELRKIGVPADRIFRNVYIPISNGKTTEIDILILSKKGLLAFEHKTYNGRIYGDGGNEKWVQYLGGQKNYFRSPIRQNQYHARCLRRFVGNDVPIFTFVSRSQCGKWEVRNIPQEAHLLRRKGDFARIYESLPQWSGFEDVSDTLKAKFIVLSRPTDGTREKHIDDCH